MKITSFNPLILTKDPEDTIKLFEALGFERHHTKDGLDDREDIVGVRMKDANGFYVDVVETGRLEQGMTMIRMNVDNFEEAEAFLESKGFKPLSEESVTDASSRSIGMCAPSGFMISLVEHIKK